MNPIPDEEAMNEQDFDEDVEVTDYTICKLGQITIVDHGIFSFNQVLKNHKVLTPAQEVLV